MVYIIILAAGKGTRMGGDIPKVLRKVKGETMLEHVAKTARSISNKIIIVVSQENKSEIEKLNLEVEYVVQKELNGTASAVISALPNIYEDEDILVLLGDVPFLKSSTLQKILEHKECVILGFVNPDINNRFGRIKLKENFQNQVDNIIEYSEATIEERKIETVNSGILFLKSNCIKYLYEIDNNNSKSEYYLTDIVKILNTYNITVSYQEASLQECLGANTPEDLLVLESIYKSI